MKWDDPKTWTLSGEPVAAEGCTPSREGFDDCIAAIRGTTVTGNTTAPAGCSCMIIFVGMEVVCPVHPDAVRITLGVPK
jgi:hypothetical protein